MNKIEVDDDVLGALAAQVSGFNQTPNDVLRRLLRLDEVKHIRVVPDQQAHEDSSTPIDTSALLAIPEAEGRYLSILGTLYREHTAAFVQLEQYGKGKRAYFSKSAEQIRGSHDYGAKRIPGSPYFALTTLDNAAKRKVLHWAMTVFGYSTSAISKALETIPSHSRSLSTSPAVR